MSKETNISWCDSAFNPWHGCEKISPACTNCYAEAWVKRLGKNNLWGKDSEQMQLSSRYWNEPYTWNREACESGERKRVFSGSMCDVFEHRDDLYSRRKRLFNIIEATEHLDWLLLTKRPENILSMIPKAWREIPVL